MLFDRVQWLLGHGYLHQITIFTSSYPNLDAIALIIRLVL
jgi:hypothetical protein